LAGNDDVVAVAAAADDDEGEYHASSAVSSSPVSPLLGPVVPLVCTTILLDVRLDILLVLVALSL